MKKDRMIFAKNGYPAAGREVQVLKTIGKSGSLQKKIGIGDILSFPVNGTGGTFIERIFFINVKKGQIMQIVHKTSLLGKQINRKNLIHFFETLLKLNF